jgi:hypothetical protein
MLLLKLIQPLLHEDGLLFLGLGDRGWRERGGRLIRE